MLQQAADGCGWSGSEGCTTPRVNRARHIARNVRRPVREDLMAPPRCKRDVSNHAVGAPGGRAERDR